MTLGFKFNCCCPGIGSFRFTVPLKEFMTYRTPRLLAYEELKVRTVHWGTAVAQLVEALRYKSEGRGFDSRWCHWNFSLT